MKVTTMKNIDHYLGLVICFYLGAIERVFTAFKKRRKPTFEAPVQGIAISKYFGLGSIILATPMIRAVRKKFPDAKIIFLTFPENASLLRLIKDIDEIKIIRTGNIFLFTLDMLRILFYLRHKKIDLFFDLEFFSKFSSIVAYLSAARVRVGYYMQYLSRRELLTHCVHYNYYKHISEVFLSQAQVVGADSDDLSVIDLRNAQILKDNYTKIQEFGIKQEDKVVVVNVNAGEVCLERRWPAQNYIELISRLATDYPMVKFVFIGTRDEKPYVDAVFKILSDKPVKNIINLSRGLSFGQLCALLSQSFLFIGNDSGPLHLSSAFRIPTISFFGPETPILYGPQGSSHLIFYKGIYCSPCLTVYNAKTATCNGQNKCMEAIKVEEVFGAAREKIHELLSPTNVN